MGTIWFATSFVRGASNASTSIDGLDRVRSAIDPEPSSWISGYTRVSDRNSSSVTSIPSHVKVERPSTATSPSSVCNDAIIRARAMIASGSGPPNAPEWTAWGKTSTRTWSAVAPRTLVVIVGTPVRTFPLSATITTSARRRSTCPCTRSGRCSVEHSSSPSTTTLIVTGGSPSARSARIAAAWIAIPHLSSELPRPKSRPPTTVGSNGGCSQSRGVGGGLHVVVGVQQDRRRAAGSGSLPEDGGMPAVELEQLHVGEPGISQDRRRRLRAGAHVRRVVAVVADRGDRDEPAELLDDPRTLAGDTFAEVDPWRRRLPRRAGRHYGYSRSSRQPVPVSCVAEAVV